jgi:putative acetyltransferase
MKIRKYQTTDYKEIADLFYETVHSVCANDYTAEELEAWAPTPIDYEKWQKRLEKRKPFVVIINHLIVGFAELEKDGHIDCFYVHKNY